MSKPFRFTIASLLSALSLAAAAAPTMEGGSCDMDMKSMHGMAGPMGMRHLDLSDAQHDKVFDLMYGQARQRHELMRAIRNNRAALREQARAPAFDAARAKALADEQAKLVSQQVMLDTQMEVQLRALLTPEQKKKLDEQRDEGPRGEREHMGPGRMPRPW